MSCGSRSNDWGPGTNPMSAVTKYVLTLGFCASLLNHLHDLLLKWDVVRYVESDADPKTGEDRIWHVWDKGELPPERDPHER